MAVSAIEIPEPAAIHVLHLDTGKTWRGGQQQVYLLHRELTAMGVASSLLARARGELEARCRTRGLPLRSMAGSRPWHVAGWPALRRAANDAQILHAHDSHAAGLSAVARLFNPKLSIVCHRRVSYPVRGKVARRPKYRPVKRWIAASAEIAASLERSGVAADQVRVVHSALDVDGFQRAAAASDEAGLRRELGLEPQVPVVAVVAALEAQKGHRVLLRAAPQILARVPNAVILCVGSGSMRRSLEQDVETAGLSSSVRFTGFRADVAAVTRLSTVAVAPSVDGEGSSASLKEAMALGKAIVASELPGNREVLGDAAVLVPPADPLALAEGVGALLGNADERQRLAKMALSRVDRFRPPRLTEAVVEIYLELLAARSAALEVA
jgi:glycosyltransferase involved in cell wall biosynthesis